MWPSSYGMLANPVGKFLDNLTYSESPSLFPEMTADVTSLSGSARILGVVVGQSVGCARFEFFTATNGRWCGGDGDSDLGKIVVRKDGAGAGAGR